MKVFFKYSDIYDAHMRSAWENLPEKEGKYPSPEQVKEFMRALEIEWRKDEQIIFDKIADISGLKWNEKDHTCYVVGYAEPFSDPLTIPVFSSEAPIDYVSDVLCHEMIHRNLIQKEHGKVVHTGLDKLRKLYPNESENVIIHILVHAIHKIVFLDIYSQERLDREKWVMSGNIDYSRSWEIVEREGAAEIIKNIL